MIEAIKAPLVSTRFIIGSLVTLSIIMAFVFTSVVVHAATPNITADENMMVGSDGYNVSILQQLLSETGYLNIPTGTAFGHFGPLTKSALARYQAATGVYPAVGYFGPVTKISMNTDYRARGWLPLLGW
jgi:hypothetical protein